MASLLREHLVLCKPPFTNTGVDYFGPISDKRGRVTRKRRGCTFTYLTIRAVHLEVAGGLSTDSFITASRRFHGRRGNPKTIRSVQETEPISTERTEKWAKLCGRWVRNESRVSWPEKGSPGISTRRLSHLWKGYLGQLSSMSRPLKTAINNRPGFTRGRNRHYVKCFFEGVLYFGWSNQPSSSAMGILHWLVFFDVASIFIRKLIDCVN